MASLGLSGPPMRDAISSRWLYPAELTASTALRADAPSEANAVETFLEFGNGDGNASNNSSANERRQY